MATAPKAYENFNNRRASTTTPYPASATEGSSYFSHASPSQRRASAHKPPTDKPTQQPDRLPPDVARARLDRINNELISMLKKPHDPHGRRKPLQGNGTYTHIDGPTAPPVPLFPHDRYTKPRDEPGRRLRDPIFVALAGDSRPKSSDLLKAELDPGVQRAYEVLTQALVEADQFEKGMIERGLTYDPLKWYDALPVPGVKGKKRVQPPPPPPLPKLDTGAAPARDRERGRGVEMGGVMESRSVIGKNGAVGSPAEERSRLGSIAMDIAMGNMPGGGEGARRESLPTPITPITPATTGTTYDASRDPRRRGR
ncbi:hypothetical protein BDV96DRAFT_596664 [Lophiotrema nucula]|uniref:Uncharacterized protein n=1 Tax=Lophiotrema nucula TaxID=690887 RepID=A0A6A5ZH95_9PLEO|nr:hypothetical protein BDV96DRAFT_596664 [Lophiotrema nucula]